MDNRHVLLIAQLKRLARQDGVDFDASELTFSYAHAANILARCAEASSEKVQQLVMSLTSEYLPTLVGQKFNGPLGVKPTPDHRELYAAQMLEKGKDALTMSLWETLGSRGDDLARKAWKCRDLGEFKSYCERVVNIVADLAGAIKAEKVRQVVDDYLETQIFAY